jgi:hypothetical protein
MTRWVRSAAALLLGLVLGGLPFVYYRYGVGRHHAQHRQGADHASHSR